MIPLANPLQKRSVLAVEAPISIANIKLIVPLDDARHWTANPNWIYEEKKDGVRAILQNHILSGRNRIYPCQDVPADLETSCFDGELVGSTYWVFDLLIDKGADIRQMALAERRTRLRWLSPLFPSWMRLIPCAANGGEFLEAVLRDGGEGVVAKDLNQPYGKGWYKCVKQATHDCVVTARHDKTRSLSIAQYIDGSLTDCGKVASLSDVEWSTASIGDVVEILCHSRHTSGKFRQPRVNRLRPDKPASECVY